MSYHDEKIPKGEYGELSKVLEEVREAINAEEQGVRLMVLLELSDLVGAIEGYLERHFPIMDLDALQDMARVTRNAFESGRRS